MLKLKNIGFCVGALSGHWSGHCQGTVGALSGHCACARQHLFVSCKGQAVGTLAAGDKLPCTPHVHNMREVQ